MEQQTTKTTTLRLMCSSGGHIVPRPHDKTLRYIGGHTHIVTMHRHTTLSNLINHLTKTVLKSSTYSSITTTSFTIKYQLPSEELDTLISVTTDEDLENMIHEYDRLKVNVNMTSRIRLFLFPDKGERVVQTVMSEEWYVNALNGTTSSLLVNSLFSLEDDVEVDDQEKEEVSYNKYVKLLQDELSVPETVMLETTSSLFGSASSTSVKYDEVAHLPSTNNNIIQQVYKDSTYLPLSTTTRVCPQCLYHRRMPSFYPVYPSQTWDNAQYPALGQHNLVYYMPARQVTQGYNLPLGAYRAIMNSGALASQLVYAPSRQQHIQSQFVGYPRVYQRVASGARGGNCVYAFVETLQPGRHVYYGAQPLMPQSTAQY